MDLNTDTEPKKEGISRENETLTFAEIEEQLTDNPKEIENKTNCRAARSNITEFYRILEY